MRRLSLPRLSTARAAVLLVATAALPLVVSGQAFAQASPSAPMHPMAAAPAPAPAAPALPADVAAKLEQHISQLHDQLGVTPAQQPQWQQYAQVMRENTASMRQVLDERGTKLSSLNAVENLQSYAQVAQVHAANMQRLVAAFQPLYASFSDTQKQTADDVFRNKIGAKPHHKS